MANTIKETFAKRLARIRKIKGLSQYGLADLSGLSQRMIAHYETIATNPPAEAVIQIAKALKVSTDELLGIIPTKENGCIVKNRKLLKKIKILDELPPKDQKSIINHIDDLNAKHTLSKAKK